MNKLQRHTLERIINEIEDLKSQIEDIMTEEQDKQDNTPENLQGTELYDRRQDAIQDLEFAYDNISDCIDNLNNAIQ
jgi:hypothetical protein